MMNEQYQGQPQFQGQPMGQPPYPGQPYQGQPYPGQQPYQMPPVNPCPTNNRFGSIREYHSYIFGIVAYCGLLGIIIVALTEPNAQKSDYLRYHLNQSLVMWLFGLLKIIPILGWIWGIFVLVCQIIALVYAIKGEAKSATFFGNIRIIK